MRAHRKSTKCTISYTVQYRRRQVCVLGEAGAAAEAAFARVLQRYRETSGHEPYVVEGSSAGALQFGHAVVRLKAV